MQRKITSVVTLSMLSLLAACGSKMDPTEANFGAALAQYFDKKGDFCLGMKKWPVNVSEADFRMASSVSKQMTALESIGLVKGVDAEQEDKGLFGYSGARYKVKSYSMTEAARLFVHEKEVNVIGLDGSGKEKYQDLCWGKKALDKVVKWEGPVKFGEYQEAKIFYTYKIDSLADWAKNPIVQAVFPAMKVIVEGAGTKEEVHVVKLTSIGWEAKGLMQ